MQSIFIKPLRFSPPVGLLEPTWIKQSQCFGDNNVIFEEYLYLNAYFYCNSSTNFSARYQKMKNS